MNTLDYVVLVATIAAIASYGAWRARSLGRRERFFKANRTAGWITIGLSAMATQAGPITFISMPGLAYETGMGFVQNYFGLPLALIVVSVVFLPLYQRLHVDTAYEFLGWRFDAKTRLLGAGLFLLQRGLLAGVTIYAPAVILSATLGWRIDLTIVVAGLAVVAYAVRGGSSVLGMTQELQMAVLLVGMAVAFVIGLGRLPADLGVLDGARLAGAMGRINAVDLSTSLDHRYTLWSGLLGGFFLALSYFGTDQLQVERYLGGAALRESRLGMMFNALFKIPMQAGILALGVLIFMVYQFERPPIFFNQPAWTEALQSPKGESLRAIEGRFEETYAEKEREIAAWQQARRSGHAAAEAAARDAIVDAQHRMDALRGEARAALLEADPAAETRDTDYIFLTFVTTHLPHGVIGLLIAVIGVSALSSKAVVVNALSTTTALDLYRQARPGRTTAHYMRVARGCKVFWGLSAIAFALLAHAVDNLIEAVNMVGSIFYGVVLGLFVVGFFLRRIGGTAVFTGAIAAQVLVVVLFFTLSISYLWYNVIGCFACVALSILVQGLVGPGGGRGAEEPSWATTR